MNRAYEAVAEIGVDPATARVYEFGWQSWTPSTAYPVTAPHGYQPIVDGYPICADRAERPRLPQGFQGEGLLAVETAEGGSVHVFGLPDAKGPVPSIRARLTGGRVVVGADAPVAHTEHGPGLYQALAAFADRHRAPRIREIPRIWASWYQYFTRFTEADLVENLDAMRVLELSVDVVRLDDAFQSGIGDWLTPSTGFASLPGMVKRVLDSGRRAGIWVAPMMVGEHSMLYADHPDWLVRDETGAPRFAQNNWNQNCYALDVTHPAAADYLYEVFTAYLGYGCDYFMVDFMFAGALEGVRHDDVDGLGAYERAMALIRDAIGPQSLLQGCGAPMFPSIGWVDSMRVGPDVAPYYASPSGDLSYPAQESAALTTIGRAFAQGRFWVNDPDCFIVRPDVERREDWAAVVDRYGAARLSSDRLQALDEWGLATTRELLVPSRVEPFDPAIVAL